MIEIENNGHIRELYINTNETNSMDLAFFQALDQAIESAQNDPAVKAVLLSGRNEKFFSNGFDPALFVGRNLEEIKVSLRAALAAAGYLDTGEGDQTFYRAKVATARFYADQMLPQAAAYAETVRAGDSALAGIGDEVF